jgi:flagellar protein FlgJ
MSPLNSLQRSSMPISAVQGLASDTRSLQALKGEAARDPKAAVEQAARQLESLFMQELLKNMRKSTLAAGMLDNEGTEMGHEMLDQQLALQMTGRPGGLGEAIKRQLERQIGGLQPAGEAPVDPAFVLRMLRERGVGVGPASDPNPPAAPAKPAVSAPSNGPVSAAPVEFVREHGQAARAAQQTSGIPAEFMLAQAGHESGWGKRRILMADGSDSHNLFGIKAGPNWKGPVATITTTEYIDGEPRKVQARFRAYASNEEAFADYARLITQSPRYSRVVEQANSAQGFAQSLQNAGYATDPAYAEKLGRAINTTLRVQRMLS